MSKRRISAGAIAIVAALVVAACGSSSSSTSSGAASSASSSTSSSGGSATLNGAGSTFAAPIYQQWGSTLKGQGLTVNYNAVGSGAGVSQLQAATVAFAGNDSPLKSSDVKGMKGPVLEFPVAFGSITVSYNLSGIKSGLKLDGPTLANIYLGKIKSWNDPAIKALNPGMSLPSTAITVVHRSDSSGTTDGFTKFLAAVSPTWELASWSWQGREVADRYGRGEERRCCGGGQADPGRSRVRRAGVRARERVHVRRGQEQVRQLHPADDLQYVGGGCWRRGSGEPWTLDDQLARASGVSDRVADVHRHVHGPVQERRAQLARPRAV